MHRNPYDPTIRLLHAMRRDLQRKRRLGRLTRAERERLAVIQAGLDRLELAEQRWLSPIEIARLQWLSA
jgi:hypothetical protein